MILDGEVKGLIKHWRGFETMGGVTKGVNFLRQLESVICLVSKSFIEGVLTDD